MALCGVVEDVRNFSDEAKTAMRQFVKDMLVALDDPSAQKLPKQLKELREMMEQAPMKEAA